MSKRRSRPTRSERLYRLLVRTYPRSFRARYGEELLVAFREQRQEERYRRSGGLLRFWTDVLWDLARTQWAARRLAAAAKRRASSPGGAAATGMGRGGMIVEAMWRDLKFACRGLVRAPGFALLAVLTLALGIGSTAAIFGVVNAVLLRPLPYGDAGGLVTIWSSWNDFPKTWVSLAEYRAYLTGTRSFTDIALWYESSATFTDAENPERIELAGATENLTRVLDVDLAAGRFFTRDEARVTDSNPSDVIVVSHELWSRRWNRDPALIGRLVEMNGRTREVIGVLPEGFRLPNQFGLARGADVYVPMWIPREEVSDYPQGGGSHFGFLAARMRDGVTVEQARSDIQGVIDRQHAAGAYPTAMGFRPLVFAADDDVLGSIRPALLTLLATVGFVLLIACANVANLLLARSQRRGGELAVRGALGAGRSRLVGQLLVESVVLAALGGALGVVLAVGSVELLQGLNPGNLPRIDEVSVDGRVLAFASAISLLTALLFGTLPALRTTRSSLNAHLRRRSSTGIGGAGWQGTLVAAQLALAVILLMGAGLMLRTFDNLTSIDPGFRGQQLLTMQVSLPNASYPDGDATTAFYREVMRRMEELPSVEAATAVRLLPLSAPIGDWSLDVPDYDAAPGEQVAGDWQIAAPGYVEAMGIPLIRGRTFTRADGPDGMPVAMVNEAFVRRYWPGEDPLGKQFRLGGTELLLTVVGVVGDVTHNGLTEEIKGKFYVPLDQWPGVTGDNAASMSLLVKTAGPPEASAPGVRAVIRDLDPTLAVADVRPVEELIGSAVAQPRFLVVLMGTFAGIAILLALIGIYGVTSYGVGQRRREIGIRMALGAEHGEVVSLVVRSGSTMVLVGLAVGVSTAFLLSRFLESMLYGVSAQDPATYAVVAVGFAVVAWAATYLPSRRAARVDPIQALKVD